ncbi:MAG: DUF748 domain-containing protein [Desulfobulbaceae bacterium]|nr:DUF748 domain-containing protein [Desulfobulbaceae bacterium]HIJ89695.1 DUF748 domain-containing protein [Deltaproteobacteria bacterium]
MSESIETARHHLTLPPVWRRSLCLLGVTLALLLTVYTLAGFFLAPYLVTRYVPQYAAEQLHLQVHLGQVRINPLLFTCEVKDLSLQIDEEEPFFSVHRIFIDFEPETLFRRIWTFADLAIESPNLRLVIGPDGRLNLAKLAERVPQAEAQPNAEKKSPPRLLLKHLALSAGTVQVADHSKALPTDTTIEPINLEFNNISTLPEQLSTYTVSASIPDGGNLGWQGEMTLQPISATGSIDIKDFKPAAIWNHFRDRLNLAEPTGTAQLTASYHFSTSKGEAALLVNPLSLSLHGLSLTEKGASQPLLKLGSLTASGGQIDFVTHRIVFPSIMLKGGRVAALVDKTGLGNWQRLIKQGTKSPAPKKQNTQAKPTGNETLPWQIGVKAFSATDLDLHYSDASRATPITLDADLAMSLAEGSLDLGSQEASIKRIALTGGGITLTQTPVGAVTAADHKKTRPETRQETTREETSARKRPWKLALDQLSVSGFHLGFADQKRKPPLAYDLTDLRAEVTDFSTIGEKPIAFEAQAGIRQGGSASLAGTMSQADGQIGQIEAQVAIAQLNLKPLESLIAQHAALTLASGDLTANTHLRYTTGSTPSSLTVEGEAKIGTLLLNEENTGERFLAWKELAANGLEFGLNPDQLAIKELRLQNPGAKITIFKDKSFNLIKILRQKDEAETEKPEKPLFPVDIERVRLKNGVVDFADFSLVLPFSTRITEVKGAASGISTKPSTRTSLKFEGRIGEFGQAKANGSLAPANPKQFTDIKVNFRNVAMPPLSPYSATFAGRNIASGKLNLDLGYNIKDSELLGENSVVLKDFTLGEHVESPSALDLPLDLAIALLTDGEGKIDIAVPIRGNIDHPEFSYGHVFRQALFNLLTKVVTAPFRALGALFGSHSENMDTILFEPGRVELAPPEQEKLKNVAEALGKRTQLQLTVHGGFEPGLDGKALKTSQFRRTLVQKFGVQPGPLTFDNAKTQRALEKLAGDKLAPFQTGYEDLSGKKVKRVNPALALFGQAGEDREFYRALFEYLVESAPLPQAELEKLAEQRGMAIVQELTGRADTDMNRITLGAVVQSEEQDEGVPAKLELGLR